MTYFERLEAAKTYVTDRLSQAELLTQLAEEAAELTHAALKLRRALDGTNPTPVNASLARAALREEVADTRLLVRLLELDCDSVAIEGIMDAKILRWENRLKKAEK